MVDNAIGMLIPMLDLVLVIHIALDLENVSLLLNVVIQTIGFALLTHVVVLEEFVFQFALNKCSIRLRFDDLLVVIIN